MEIHPFPIGNTSTQMMDGLQPAMLGYRRVTHLSNEKHPGCLGYRGDYTTQL